MIYFDNAATTKPYEGIESLFQKYIEQGWFNPSALYPAAVAVERHIDAARTAVAAQLGMPPDSVIFTSGGTESANTVILRGYRSRGTRNLSFVTSRYEHACVYGAFKELEAQGHSVTYVSAQKDGLIHAEDVARAVTEDTVLVSIMHVNNETGAINDIAAIAAATKQKNPQTLFHADGVQGFLKVPFSMVRTSVDYYTVSAHKVHGLKGTGAIVYQKGAPLKCFMLGGGQERGLRSGTENTFGICAFKEAISHYLRQQDAGDTMLGLRAQMLSLLTEEAGMYVLSPEQSFAPHILNVSFVGMRAEVLLHLLEREGIAISTGAACSSKKHRDFRIHEHLHLPKEVMEGAIRISFCPQNTEQEVQTAAAAIHAALKQYRKFTRR